MQMFRSATLLVNFSQFFLLLFNLLNVNIMDDLGVFCVDILLHFTSTRKEHLVSNVKWLQSGQWP